MEKKVAKALEELITTITSSPDYRECIELKKKMQNSQDVMKLVSKTKKLQKEYVKSLDDSIKKELDEVNEQLLSIPIYHSYLKHLEVVNSKLSLVKDELNEYFYKVVNEK